MKDSTQATNSSKYTDSWLPIKQIMNGMIQLESGYYVTGVKVHPKNIFIMDEQARDGIIYNLRNASSSPMEIFINNEKIGELKINGDNQKIPIPPNLLRKMASNTLTIKTGMNKSTTANTDYDDVELMNLFVDIK